MAHCVIAAAAVCARPFQNFKVTVRGRRKADVRRPRVAAAAAHQPLQRHELASTGRGHSRLSTWATLAVVPAQPLQNMEMPRRRSTLGDKLCPFSVRASMPGCWAAMGASALQRRQVAVDRGAARRQDVGGAAAVEGPLQHMCGVSGRDGRQRRESVDVSTVRVHVGVLEQ